MRMAKASQQDLKDIAEDAEAAAQEAERWRPMSTDLHGTVRDMVNELHRLSAEVEQQRTRAEAAEAELRELRRERGQ